MFYPDGSLAYPDLDAVAAGLIAQKGCTAWPVPDRAALRRVSLAL